MLNEYAYCPRLCYMQWVQKEWRHTADTLEGRYVHRRVDVEAGGVPSPDEIADGDRIHARSVLVGSERLGAIARVDVLESDGADVTPVDYKKGTAPDLPERAWEPERVQVCIQGLLLADNGYRCRSGVLYFVESKQRVEVEFDEALVARTLELLGRVKAMAEGGVIPPPLADSPKCPRCALVGLCLPDETNLLAGREPGEGSAGRDKGVPVPARRAEPRRLVPSRDDRLAVYVQGQGHSLGLAGENLEIREKGKVVDTVRLLDVAQVSLYGNVQISAQALRELASRDVSVVHLSYGGWLAAVTSPPPHKNVELRMAQYRAATDEEESIRLARCFVSGKLRNQRTLVRRNGRDVDQILVGRLRALRRSAERATTAESLLGTEGAAGRAYFQAFPSMLRGETGLFDFEGRNRRPPRDPVNAMLSFAYSMLVKDVLVTLIGVGFDPYLGFYHRPKYGRPALALDMMEEFRPIVADSVVIGLVNTGEIRPVDFIERAGSVALTESGRKRLIGAYERRLDQTVIHPIFGYTVSYRRVLEIQARLLGRVLLGEIERYPPFSTR
ncbi:MAG: CRISPR-associated endonuclease Cas1 [Acidobacteria bacterium]|nr:CRISPR-associated endonuclease Cas1 [Acidobacteriota bacterium]